MKRREINLDVVPFLKAWMKVRDHQEDVAADNRFSFESKRAAERAANQAELAYDEVVSKLLGSTK